jgi:putative transposase
MARLARVFAVDVPLYVTQRGNARQFILTSDAERIVYLDLLRHAIQLHGLSVIGYCLMSNHVHLVGEFYKRECQKKVFPLRGREGRCASFSPFRQR